MTTRFLIMVCAFALSNNLDAVGNESETRRSVLLLISDNQNKEDCGCYGHPVVKTPNIDRLAAEGVRFRDAFATTASCGPSRAVIYSGLQTHSNGQYGHGHGIHTFVLNPKVKTVFARLAEQGFHTALLGKQHTTHADSYPFTFDRNVNGRDVMGIAELAKEFLAQCGEDPFLLVIGYSDPHPTSRDRPGWGIVRKDDRVPARKYDPADVVVPSYLPDQPEVRDGLAGYYQQISRLDHGIGEVLEALNESGRANETLVIFTSDHGSSEPGAMGNHYEPGIQVPLIVRHPDSIGRATTSGALVTLADITPTILDWTGNNVPPSLHGRSFLPVLGVSDPAGWDEVFLSHVCHEVTMYYPMRTIRNRRYKLIWNVNWRSEYPLPIDTLQRATWTETIRRADSTIGRRSVKKFLFRDQVELYDLQQDPDEVLNLADDPKNESIRRELTGRLVNWLEQTSDPWLARHRLPQPGEPDSASSRQAKVDDETGFRSIFNGRDLDGWRLRRADRGGYRVEDGLLVCPEGSAGYLFTDRQYADFSFRFDFRLAPGANNGIAVRCPLLDAKPAYQGMEIQILDNLGYAKPLGPTQYHGSLYDVAAAKRGALKPAGEWNRQEIVCRGQRIVVTVNDVPILDADIGKIEDNELIQRHPGLSRASGHIGLLGHGDRAEFRNLRVKEL